MAPKFQQYFGKPLGRGAFFVRVPKELRDSSPGFRMDSVTIAHLAAAGAKWWIAYTDLDRANFFERAMVTHEVGHIAFQGAFYPLSVWMDQWRRAEKGLPDAYYGSPALDWLDEVSGILFEPQHFVQGRRGNFMSEYRSPTERAKFIFPLDKFFTMPYPDSIGDAFYSQCRGVVDFLWEQTKDTTILASIATSLTRGSTMADWLRTIGVHHGLPATMAKLEQDWQAWLAKQAAGTVYEHSDPDN